jgi:hypothetical protein
MTPNLASSVLSTPPLAGAAGSPSAGWRYNAVLAGMVRMGHGIEAICAYLAIGTEALLDRVVDLGLPTPHDRPMRRSGHKNAWPVTDFLAFIDCWLDHWNAGSAAEAFGRSEGSIYAQARRLGLPRRARGEIRRPGSAAVLRVRQARPASRDGPDARQLPLPLEPPPPPAPDRAVDPTLICVRVRADGTTFEFRRHPGRREVVWTADADAYISARRWGQQHYKAIAADLGISARAVSQRLYVLGLPALSRKDAFLHFDPQRAAINQAASGYRQRRCFFNNAQIFWSSGAGDRVSLVSKRSKAYRARAQAAAFAP